MHKATIFSFVFSLGLNPASGPDLAFVVFPKIFETIAFGKIFAVIFFGALFSAGLGATLSMVELLVAMLIDEFKMTRRRATLLVAAATFLVGLPSALSYAGKKITAFGMPFLDFMDHYSGMYYLPISALVLYVLLGRWWKSKEYFSLINSNTLHKIPAAYVPWIQYGIPLVLILLLVGSIVG